MWFRSNSKSRLPKTFGKDCVLLAIRVVCVIVGLVVSASLRHLDRPYWGIGFLLIFGVVPFLSWWVRARAVARFGPPPERPRIPFAPRLCPVCGSILRPQHLADGWDAVCPACGFQLELEG